MELTSLNYLLQHLNLQDLSWRDGRDARREWHARGKCKRETNHEKIAVVVLRTGDTMDLHNSYWLHIQLRS